VNRIVTLADDLSMALRALSVRVLAPIPGKPVVGIEVSNPRREKVFIRELLESVEYEHAESKLALALGKDTTGNVVVADLARMPHLLVAGATGTGKSVSMNAMVMSILYKSSPRDVRFIMIDPKMLELSIYENVPHLLVPVVTDPKKAAAALSNIEREMDLRYRLLHEKGVRNIDSYNRLLRESAGEEEAPASPEGLAHHPGRDRRRAPARRGRHALPAARHGARAAPARRLRLRRRRPPRGRLHQAPGGAALRDGAARGRRRRGGRGQGRRGPDRRDVRHGGAARHRAAPGVDLLAAAPPARRLQPRRAHDRAHGARGRGLVARGEGTRGDRAADRGVGPQGRSRPRRCRGCDCFSRTPVGLRASQLAAASRSSTVGASPTR